MLPETLARHRAATPHAFFPDAGTGPSGVGGGGGPAAGPLRVAVPHAAPHAAPHAPTRPSLAWRRPLATEVHRSAGRVNASPAESRWLHLTTKDNGDQGENEFDYNCGKLVYLKPRLTFLLYYFLFHINSTKPDRYATFQSMKWR